MFHVEIEFIQNILAPELRRLDCAWTGRKLGTEVITRVDDAASAEETTLLLWEEELRHESTVLVKLIGAAGDQDAYSTHGKLFELARVAVCVMR